MCSHTIRPTIRPDRWVRSPIGPRTRSSATSRTLAPWCRHDDLQTICTCRVGKGVCTAFPHGKSYRAPCPPTLLHLSAICDGGHGAMLAHLETHAHLARAFAHPTALHALRAHLHGQPGACPGRRGTRREVFCRLRVVQLADGWRERRRAKSRRRNRAQGRNTRRLSLLAGAQAQQHRLVTADARDLHRRSAEGRARQSHALCRLDECGRARRPDCLFAKDVEIIGPSDPGGPRCSLEQPSAPPCWRQRSACRLPTLCRKTCRSSRATGKASGAA